MNELSIDKRISNAFYIIKALAIYTVVLAHSVYTNINNDILKNDLGRLAATGVIIYLIIAGYYFNPSKSKNLFEFINKKVKTLLIPWLIWGYVVYAWYNRANPFQPKGIINWLLGNGTYLYYLTVLVLCYIVFYYLSRYKLFIAISMLLTLISLELTAFGIIPSVVDTNKLAFTYFTNPYLNIFNWIGFFAVGIYIQEKGLVQKYYTTLCNYWWIFSLIALIILSVFYYLEKDYSYFSKYGFICETFMATALLSLSFRLNQNRLLIDIGKKTLPIYLIHLPILGRFSRILPYSKLFAISRPIIVIILIYTVLFIIHFIAQKLKISKYANIILGLR